MTPTIYSFTRALRAPAESLSTLRDIRPVSGPSGMPRLSRTTRFAEAEIEWQGARWLLCMPLTTAAIPDIERTATYLKTLRSEWLAEYRLLRDEMRYEDFAGTEHRSDLVLQYLPGIPFADALTSVDADTLLTALEALQAELEELDISHRNLKPENLRWHDGRIVPIRYHYACRGTNADTEAFAALRIAISRSAGSAQTAHDVQSSYESSGNDYPGHRWMSHTFEQLICVEDETGWGYVDTSNRPVIPAQFLWADDFHEGRATVETADGMGLIDKQGRYVIPAQYKIVEYDAATGLSRVRQGELWATFDYEGNRLDKFEVNN